MRVPVNRVRLPSGSEVRVRAQDGALARDDRLDGEPVLFGRAWSALLAPGALERRERDRWIPFDRDAVWALPLRDAHVLRDLLLRIGAIAPEPEDGICRNCDAVLAFDPRELDPEELADRPPAPLDLAPLALPAPVRLPRNRIATHATIVPVSLAQAIPLLRALARDEPYRITPKILAALGVRALGELETPAILARVLRRSSDEVWAAIERRYLELNSAPRAIAPLRCPRCGAMHEVLVPTPRELDPDEPERAMPPRADFPSAEAFEEIVERLAPPIYAARGVRIEAVALRVEPGIPATDIAGEPLLGSYEPRQEIDTAGYTQLEFVVTLYYRTFQRIWAEDGPYDLEAELRETIDHELEHHLHHLAGHDPMDAEERTEARRELRKLYGDKRLAKLAIREAGADLGAAARALGPILAIVAALAALAAAMGGWR